MQLLFKMSNTHIPKLVYEYSPTSRINIGDQGKDGETNTYEDRTSLDDLNPVADNNIIKCVLCKFCHKNLVL